MVNCRIDDRKSAPSSKWAGRVIPYIRALKPRETVLLTFIGICASIVANAGLSHADFAGMTKLASGIRP